MSNAVQVRLLMANYNHPIKQKIIDLLKANGTTEIRELRKQIGNMSITYTYCYNTIRIMEKSGIVQIDGTRVELKEDITAKCESILQIMEN